MTRMFVIALVISGCARHDSAGAVDGGDRSDGGKVTGDGKTSGGDGTSADATPDAAIPVCTTTGPWTDVVVAHGGATVGRDGAALAPDGTIYIPYQDPATVGLALAHRAPNTTTFTLDVIDAAPASHWNGNYPAIAIDSGGGIHIADYDSRENTLRFAERSGTTWATGRIGAIGNGGTKPAVAIDSADGVHVIFTNDSLDLQYAYHAANANGSWTVTPVGLSGDRPLLAAAPDGSLHVVYAGAGGIHYARRAAGAPTFTDLGLVADGDYASVAVDPQANVHIAIGGGGVRYFFLPAGGTVFAETSFGEATAQQPTIAVEAWGAVHVGYIEGTAGSTEYIHYAYKPPGGTFTTELVSDLGEADLQAAITIDGHGGIHVTHQNYHFDTDTSYVQDAYLDRTCTP
jgi:hypothetical protein